MPPEPKPFHPHLTLGRVRDPRGLEPLLAWEEAERHRRSLERRLRCAHIGRFKPLADFDWSWPTRGDQAAIAALMTLDFL